MFESERPVFFPFRVVPEGSALEPQILDREQIDLMAFD